MEPTRLDRRSAVEPVRRQVCGLRQKFKRALEEGQSAEEDVVFHVKQSWFRSAFPETILYFGRLSPIVPLFVVILRSLRRRIFALHSIAAVIVGGLPVRIGLSGPLFLTL
jgi:hypothetical protein